MTLRISLYLRRFLIHSRDWVPRHCSSPSSWPPVRVSASRRSRTRTSIWYLCFHFLSSFYFYVIFLIDFVHALCVWLLRNPWKILFSLISFMLCVFGCWERHGNFFFPVLFYWTRSKKFLILMQMSLRSMCSGGLTL